MKSFYDFLCQSNSKLHRLRNLYKKKKKRKKVEGRERENVRSELRYEYFRKVGKYGRLEVEVGHQWPRKIAGRVVGI